MLDQILSTAEDLVPLGSVDKERVRFAFPFRGKIAKHYFDMALANPAERDLDGFNRHWKYNPKTGLIEGSSTLLTLRLSTKTRLDGIEVPTLEEGMLLDKKGKLTNGAYRDFGVVVYSNGEPNQKVAEEIISQTKRELPLVISFGALDYRVDADFPNAIAVFLAENQDEVRSGKKAEEILSKGYKESSGVCRVFRYGDGVWGANWGGLDYSNDYGQVDWMCGEAMRADLKVAYKGVLERKYDVEINKLNAKKETDAQDFLESLAALGKK